MNPTGSGRMTTWHVAPRRFAMFHISMAADFDTGMSPKSHNRSPPAPNPEALDPSTPKPSTGLRDVGAENHDPAAAALT